MQLFLSLLFGISASLDALLIGISLGIQRTHIKPLQNLFISLVALLGTCTFALLGTKLTPLLPAVISGRIGSFFLFLLGNYYILKQIVNTRSEKKSISQERPDLVTTSGGSIITYLSLPQLLLYSITLSANNLGIGLSTGMSGIHLLPASLSTFFWSAVFLFTGNRLGQRSLIQSIGNRSDLISGLLLICLSFLQFIF